MQQRRGESQGNPQYGRAATSGEKVCFVIMPFSKTKTCSESEWTKIFEDVFKPAVEESGLGYDCRRSAATRGNIVKDILLDLQDSKVVLADLTDWNPNVFYELGVRHAMTNRTILVTQNLEEVENQRFVYLGIHPSILHLSLADTGDTVLDLRQQLSIQPSAMTEECE